MTNIAMVVHGSSDKDYIESLEALTHRLGIGYLTIVNYGVESVNYQLTFPLFLVRGMDYERALSIATVKLPPLLEQPEFLEELRRSAPDTLIMHGLRRGNLGILGILARRGFKPYFLKGEPSISRMSGKCPDEAYLLFIFKGFEFNEAYNRAKNACPGIKLHGPLSSDEWFIDYLSRLIERLLSLNG